MSDAGTVWPEEVRTATWSASPPSRATGPDVADELAASGAGPMRPGGSSPNLATAVAATLYWLQSDC